MDLNNTIILSIIGSLFIILLGIIGYFLQRLVKSTDNLTSIVNRLELLVDSQKTACYEKHKSLNQLMTIIDANINGIFKRLSENEKTIENIKGHLKLE